MTTENNHYCTKILNFISRRKKRTFLLLLSISAYIYYRINIHSFAWYANHKKFFSHVGHPCLTPSWEMAELITLSRDTHVILNELKLKHMLIYGSLWGALRYNNPLPWDNDFDMALFEDQIRHYDTELIKEAFNKRNITISYRLWFGTYRVTRGASARGDLMVYRKSYIFGDYMVRTGIEAYVAFINYLRFHTFPVRLVEGVLPKRSFAGVKISVPKEGGEIQKYFYPNDWWKETKPRGC